MNNMLVYCEQDDKEWIYALYQTLVRKKYDVVCFTADDSCTWTERQPGRAHRFHFFSADMSDSLDSHMEGRKGLVVILGGEGASLDNPEAFSGHHDLINTRGKTIWDITRMLAKWSKT